MVYMRTPLLHRLLGSLVMGLMVIMGCTAPASSPPTAAPTAVAAKPATSPSAVASAGNVAAPKPAGATVAISSPKSGDQVSAGSVKVTVSYTGPALVPAAQATKLDDYHLHYFLDEDPGPYIGTTTPIPAGNPRIIHTAALEV